MEKWQKSYLTANMGQLLEETICNVTLLSRLKSARLLSQADLDDIISTPKQLERTARLYDILQTRKGAFGAMSRALSEGMQSSAYEIFQKGYIEYLPPILNISFSEEAKPLSNYLDEAEIREIIQKHVHFFEYKGSESETIPLLNKAPPPDEPPLYIPRQLFRRNVVNIRLFQEKSPDIFVFKGVHDFCKLFQMVRPQIASKSSSQLGNLTCRFIQLEDDDDWKEICDIASAPVHLIKYEDETKTCVLEQTKGISTIINQHVRREQKSENPDMAVSENMFIHNVVTGSASGVCICDLPGMGKTLLLAEISNKISKLYPDRLVAFISLSQFIKSVAFNDIPQNCSKEVAQKFLVEYLTSSPLAQDILDKMITKEKIQMELLFDAFDEVPFQFIGFTKSLLTVFATKLPNARIYVTSRPHMRQELEDSLGVHSYDIFPFSEANQLGFLVSFWKGQNRVDDDKKLEEFAKYILGKLKTSLSKTEQDMTGIPLQCRLLAQVYSRGAKLYTRGKMLIQECCHFEGSLPQLYREYVEQSFEKKLSSALEEVTFFEVQKYHIYVAIKTLFPECESQRFQELTGDLADSVEELSISIGILERRSGGGKQTVEFIHRTFAEYFVSEFFVQMLNDSQLATSLSSKLKSEAIKLLLEKALMLRVRSDTDQMEDHVFVYSVVAYFIDFFLGIYHQITSIQQVVQQFTSSISPKHLRAIFFGCAHENYPKLLRFIHTILLAINKMTLEQYKKEMLPLKKQRFRKRFGDGSCHVRNRRVKPGRLIRLLNVASLLSSHSFVEELFALVLECFELDLSAVCNDIPLYQDTPLHFAIGRADLQMVQFFATKVSLEGRDLLGSCIIGSNEYPLETVERKVEICKILLDINGSLLTEANYLLYDSIHVELIKVLIKAGADARATESGETVVKRLARDMASSDFHELCHFLILDHKAEDLFLGNELKWKSPLPYILRRQEKLSIETFRLILEIDGVNVNEKYDYDLFLIAVEEKYDMDLLDLLAKVGADIQAINVEGQNALHLAKNAHILQFLLNLGLDYRLQDSEGNTFLHLFGSEGVTAVEYQAIVSGLAAKGQTDVIHMKNDDEQLPIHWAVYHLEVMKETLQLFKSNSVDFNAVDDDSLSVLMYAAVGGRSVQFLKILIDMGTDVTKRNANGETFAHLIAKYCTAEQFHELVVFLISKGFDEAFTTVDKSGRTPLHWAAFYVELLPETLELIYRNLVQENKVDINSKCSSDRSILMYAAAGNRSFRILKTLIEMGVNVYTKDKSGNGVAHYIHQVSIIRYRKMVEFLKSREQQEAVMSNPPFVVQSKSLLTSRPGDWLDKLFKRTKDKYGTSRSVNEIGYCVLLSAAEKKRSVSLLKNLIENGADINIQNNKGDNFAHCIAYSYSEEQYHELTEFIISRGEQQIYSVANKNGEIPIHVAVLKLELLNSTLDLFDSTLFQTKIVDINSTDEWGNSVLVSAVKGKQTISFLKSLIEKGADIHIQNRKDDNFAHCIAYSYLGEQYHELVEFLISRGEQKIFTVANNEGKTPIHVAVFEQELPNSTLDLFHSTLFQTKIVDVNCRNKSWDSILMSAVTRNRSVRLLKKLIEKGADIQIQDELGNNFAHRISFYYPAGQYHEIIKSLINIGKQNVFSVTNKNGQTPIHVAVLKLELLNSTLDLYDSTLFQPKIVDINCTNKWGNSILMSAVVGKRSVRLLKNLIEKGADIQIKNKDGNNFAHRIPSYYSPEQYHEIVEFLISRGQQNVFAVVNEECKTPIQLAISEMEILESTLNFFDSTLFQAKIVDINSTDVWGNSLLMSAAEGKRSVRLLTSLIERGANIYIRNIFGDNFAHCLPRFYSAGQYHELVDFMIRRGKQKAFSVANNDGKTPIHVAILELELLNSTLDLFNSTLFQKNIVDINATDKSGNSIIMSAAVGKRSVRLLKNLVKKGGDIHIQNRDGNNFAHRIAFSYSAEQYHELVKFLTKRGQQKVFEMSNHDGNTPMHFAVYKLELNFKTLDLLAGFSVSTSHNLLQTAQHELFSQVDNDGNSVLHYALRGKRSLQFIKHLISLGANWSAKNNNYYSLAHLSASYGLIEHLKYFVELGCDVNALDNDGNDVLHRAVYDASNNVIEMVKFLLGKGRGENPTRQLNELLGSHWVRSYTDRIGLRKNESFLRRVRSG